MKQAFMVVDLGTGNSRIAIVSAAGEILALVRENSVFYTDHRFEGGQCFSPDDWAKTILDMAKRALAEAGDVSITAVTASSLRQGIVLIGHDGSPVVGYSNADRRGKPFLQEPNWERIWEITSLGPSQIVSAMKLLGTLRYEPELLEKTKYYTSISDWVGYLFTGACVWERAQAMQSALYDPQECGWSEELCAQFGLDSAKLPPLANAGSVLGKLKAEIRDELGLGEDVVFVVGTADTQAAVTGMGVQQGETIIVSGTTSPCLKVMPQFRKFQRCWVSPTAELGQFMLEVNTASSGVNMQRFKNLMLPNFSYAELDKDAIERGIPAKNLPRLLAVFLTGMHLDEDTPNGGFVMRNPVSIDLKPQDFFHALSLNVGMSITLCLQRVDALDTLEKDYLIGCGGGFTSPIIGQTIASLTGIPIRVYENFREATVHGCFILCLRALGLPQPERKRLKELTPEPSEELNAYFEHWKTCREHFKELDF